MSSSFRFLLWVYEAGFQFVDYTKMCVTNGETRL